MLLAIVACVVSLARAQFQEFVVPDFKGFHDPLAGRRQISCGAPGTPVFGRIASQTGNKPGDTVRCACPEYSHAVRHVAGCSARCNLRTHACTLVLTLPRVALPRARFVPLFFSPRTGYICLLARAQARRSGKEEVHTARLLGARSGAAVQSDNQARERQLFPKQ